MQGSNPTFTAVGRQLRSPWQVPRCSPGRQPSTTREPKAASVARNTRQAGGGCKQPTPSFGKNVPQRRPPKSCRRFAEGFTGRARTLGVARAGCAVAGEATGDGVASRGGCAAEAAFSSAGDSTLTEVCMACSGGACFVGQARKPPKKLAPTHKAAK